MFHPFLKTAPYMRILKSPDLNGDQELYRKISRQNLNQWLKTCKRSYTKRSVNKEKVQKFVSVLGVNLSVKNPPKNSEKFLEDSV